MRRVQRMWRSSDHAMPREVELLALSTRHVNEGSCAGKAELREGKAGCRPACARSQRPTRKSARNLATCSTRAATSTDGVLRPSRSRELQQRRRSTGCTGGAPKARSLLLSSHGRQPGDVVGCGRGSTGRATSRAARLRECRRGDGRAQLDRVYKANTAPEPSARKVKKKCISREPDRLPTVESVRSKYRGGQTWQLAFLFLDGRTRHLTRLRLTGSRGSEAEAAEDAAAGAATRVVAPARIQSR